MLISLGIQQVHGVTKWNKKYIIIFKRVKLLPIYCVMTVYIVLYCTIRLTRMFYCLRKGSDKMRTVCGALCGCAFKKNKKEKKKKKKEGLVP